MKTRWQMASFQFTKLHNTVHVLSVGRMVAFFCRTTITATLIQLLSSPHIHTLVRFSDIRTVIRLPTNTFNIHYANDAEHGTFCCSWLNWAKFYFQTVDVIPRRRIFSFIC